MRTASKGPQEKIESENMRMVDATRTTVGLELGSRRVRLTRVQFANCCPPPLHLSALHLTNKWIKTSLPMRVAHMDVSM